MVAALLLGLCGVVAYRAGAQSITYDEAFTYREFLRGSLAEVFTKYTATNHVLASVLSWLSVGLLGPSEFALRFPSVVAAGLYFWTVFAGSRLVFGTSWLFVITTLVLSLNPFVLDFLIAARGYGLALSLFVLGLFHLIRLLTVSTEGDDRRTLVASLALGGAVCANLTLLYPSTALVGAFLILDIRRRWAKQGFRLDAYMHRALVRLAAPGTVLVVLVLAVPLSVAKRDTFFYGADTLARSAQSLVDASLFHTREPWPPGPERLPAHALSRVVSWVVIVPLLVSMGLMARRVFDRARVASLEPVQALLFLGITTTAATGLLLVVARLAFDLPYPFGRTGLYFIPLFVLSVSSFVQQLREQRQRAARVAAGAVLTVLILCVGRFAQQFSTTFFYDWRFDAGSRQVFETISRWPVTDDTRIRVAASPWLFQPSLDFYRVLRGDARFEPVSEDWMSDPAAFDFFVVSPETTRDDLALARQHGDIVYRHPVSGAVLLVNRRHLDGAVKR